MSPYLTRFAELYESQGRRVEIMDDKLWVNYGRMIIPVGPIHLDYSISPNQAQQLMQKVPGALMVRYTYGYQEPSGCEDWYAVICDEFKDLEAFRSKHRKEIKKGLENCTIRQVDAAFIAEYGYDVYISAFSRYKDVIKPRGKIDFIKMIGTTKNFDDIYHYWGVFHENKLIAYSTVAIYGDEEADISVAKFNPEYLKLYPHASLVYSLSKCYLSNLSMRYVNAGFRTIHHKTDVQQVLIKKLSFKKKYLSLGIIYNQLLYNFLKLTYPFRKLLRKASHKLDSIYKLEEIRKKCNSEVINNCKNDIAKEKQTCDF